MLPKSQVCASVFVLVQFLFIQIHQKHPLNVASECNTDGCFNKLWYAIFTQVGYMFLCNYLYFV